MHCKEQVKLYNALKKYSIDAFSFSVIYGASTKEELDQFESFYILWFGAISHGYNCKTGGSNGRPCEETIRKQSIARTGTKRSIETRAKMAKASTGRKLSIESCEKIRQANLGRAPHNKGCKLSSEHIQKLRDRIFTTEWRARLSASRKGRSYKRNPMSEQSRENISKSLIGRRLSEEHKKKVSIASKGRVFSEEQRMRLSESMSRAWADGRKSPSSGRDEKGHFMSRMP